MRCHYNSEISEFKEKWDEVHRLRKRKVRWTIGGDKIEVGYDVCGDKHRNTTALPTVNALFHSIVSTHSFMATIDIVDYYLGALRPSPESVRIDVSSISLPTLTKLGLLPFLRHFFPFLRCFKNCPWSSPIWSLVPTPSYITSHPTWVLRNFHPHAFPPPHPLHCLHPRSGRFPRPLFPLL